MNDLLAHVLWVERTAELERLARVGRPSRDRPTAPTRGWRLRAPRVAEPARREAIESCR